MDKMAKKSIVIAVLVLMMLFQPFWTHVALAQSLTAKEIYALVNPSILTVEVYDQYGNGLSSASAFVIDHEGHAVTNYHVVEDAVSMKVKNSKGEVSNITEIIYCNKERDIAIFKLKGGNYPPPVTLGNSDNIAYGEKVFAIGNPLSLGNTISEGIISGKDRYLFGQVFLQFTTPISPGSSGGVLINESGQVIGITTATMLDGQNINFSIPINDLLKLRHKRENSKSLKPYKKTVTTLEYSCEDFSFNYPSNWRTSWNGGLVLTNADNQLSKVYLESFLVKDKGDFELYLKNFSRSLKVMSVFPDYQVTIYDEPLNINGIDFYQATVTDKSYYGYNEKYDYRLAYKDNVVSVFCYNTSEALFEQDSTAFKNILSSFAVRTSENECIPEIEKKSGTDPLPAPSRCIVLR